jgi:hypothetical protein
MFAIKFASEAVFRLDTQPVSICRRENPRPGFVISNLGSNSVILLVGTAREGLKFPSQWQKERTTSITSVIR